METNREKQICRNENISRLEHQTKEKSPPISSEEKFLAKVTEFVAKYDFDSENKVWPAVESNRIKQETTDTKQAIQEKIELNSVSTPSNKIEEKLQKKYAAPDEIKLPPVTPKKDIYTGKDLPTSAEEAEQVYGGKVYSWKALRK